MNNQSFFHVSIFHSVYPFLVGSVDFVFISDFHDFEFFFHFFFFFIKCFDFLRVLIIYFSFIVAIVLSDFLELFTNQGTSFFSELYDF